MNIMYSVSGFAVGMLVGVTGVGGGSLMTPLLVFLFGFKPAVAVGTDLVYAALTKSVGVAVHHGKHRSVDWRIVRLLAAGSLPSAAVTLYVLKNLMAVGKEITGTITFTLGIALLLTAFSLIVRTILMRKAAKERVTEEETGSLSCARFSPRWEIPTTILTGVVLGVLVTLSSVGAGALGTVVLLFLYPRLQTLKIVGTDLAHAIPLTLVAGIGHVSLGNFDLDLLTSLLIGSVPGIWIGSHLSARIPERYLRPVLASILLLIGFKFVLQ